MAAVAGTTIGEALSFAQRAIERFDAQYMLARLMHRSRASLIANLDATLDAEVAKTFRHWVDQRAAGKPVAQIVGVREFYGREFNVNEHVLIPRPETETLVEQALARLSSHFWPEAPADTRLSVLDMGTGSGAIASTLALENPQLVVTALDCSPDALRLASANAARLGARVAFLQSDWYSAVGAQQFHAIVANPPYVAHDDVHLQQGDLRFEPRIALTDESEDGLGAIRHIIDGAPTHLHAHGWLLLEHGYDQAERVRALLNAEGFTAVESIKDLAGIERVTLGRRPAQPVAA
jgi:release factor glutamine methyltransferase